MDSQDQSEVPTSDNQQFIIMKAFGRAYEQHWPGGDRNAQYFPDGPVVQFNNTGTRIITEGMSEKLSNEQAQIASLLLEQGQQITFDVPNTSGPSDGSLTVSPSENDRVSSSPIGTLASDPKTGAEEGTAVEVDVPRSSGSGGHPPPLPGNLTQDTVRLL